MKILIVTAMEEELKPLLDGFLEIDSNFVNKVYELRGEKNVIYMSNLGIGKVNAAFSSTYLINHLNPDLVVSIGTAGGVSSKLEVLDLVIAREVAYHDVDVSAFGYNIGQVPGHDTYYKVDVDKELLRCIIEQIPRVFEGNILSGDQFISDNDKSLEISQKFRDVYAVEMESTAVVDVCEKLGKKTLVIRGISDLANSNSTMEFDRYLEEVVKKFIGIVNILKEYEG